MDMIRKNLWPTLIILLTALILSLAFWPLENTQFAEGFRSAEMIEAGGEEGFAGGEGPAGALLLFGSFMKVVIFIGVGVLFTWLGSVIGRLFTRMMKAPEPI